MTDSENKTIRESIVQINQNIVTLEESVKDQRKEIREYQALVDSPNNGGYNEQSMNAAISTMKITVSRIEDVIEQERGRVLEMREMIVTLERKRIEKEIALANFVQVH